MVFHVGVYSSLVNILILSIEFDIQMGLFKFVKKLVMSSPILQLSGASIYQGRNLILSKVDLDLPKGEFMYLIGKTGSGKSSLLKTFYGDLSLKSGSGSIVGYDLPKLKTKQIPFLRRKLGIVFQDFKLLNDRTVFENLVFVLRATGWRSKKEIQLKIDEVLNAVGMQTKAFKMPFNLSGGEQQRVAIARALLNDPELILADEPTGNLDPKTSLEVMNLLEEINKSGKSILMATHDYSLIMKYPHRMIKSENGTLVEVAQNK
jgi:cell division transport system ATP-binding protein